MNELSIVGENQLSCHLDIAACGNGTDVTITIIIGDHITDGTSIRLVGYDLVNWNAKHESLWSRCCSNSIGTLKTQSRHSVTEVPQKLHPFGLGDVP